jgi:hypothetical protein
MQSARAPANTLAFCNSGEGRIGQQRASADSPQLFLGAIQIAVFVVAAGVFAEFSAVTV